MSSLVMQLVNKCRSTTTPLSERQLAAAMGYPSKWRVRRRDGIDRIYAGDPEDNVDIYFNHRAGLEAASKWVEGKSTGISDEGGQMLPREALFEEDDSVQVDYEGEWYDASIVEVTHYVNDIRYTVYYKDEDTTQENVCEEDIRAAPEGTKKKKTKNSSKEDPFAVAEKIGLPDGWQASSQGKNRYNIKSPEGKSFRTKAAALDFVKKEKKKAAISKKRKRKQSQTYAKEMEKAEEQRKRKQKKRSGRGEKAANKQTKKSSQVVYKDDETDLSQEDEDDDSQDDEDFNENEAEKKRNSSPKRKKKKNALQEYLQQGDPPWRELGHEFIGKRIRYITDKEKGSSQMGTVVGWIDDKDKDKEGQPGFVSETTGEPAALFHIVFDQDGGLASQDLEEYEILDCLLAEAADDVEESEGVDQEMKSDQGGKEGEDNMDE